MNSVVKRMDIVVGRKYESRGETKTHWINIGEAVEWSDGGISLDLHSVPVGNWWDGKAKLFERKPKDQKQNRGAPRGNQERDDEIPF